MGQYRLPNRPMVNSHVPRMPDMKSQIDQAKRGVAVQKEVADLLAEKIVAREQQRTADAQVSHFTILRLKDELVMAQCHPTPDNTNLAARTTEIETLRAQRRANARYAAAEIATMRFEHEGLLLAIEQNEAEIARHENPSPIVGVAPVLS